MQFSVYLLECNDKSLYCGYTSNIKARLELHNKGKASRYTRARLPVRFVFLEMKKSKKAAVKREVEIKRMSRKEKLKLITSSGSIKY